ncbi:MAG TPA: RHS repeat-associated core domain-containing protein, partial [Polyangia bacterium]|nr:RHS repeat-associated core domain-containing protein [Polyangia bacterium]
ASYYPHGDVRDATGAPPEDARYTGEERDEAAGLVSFGGRYADLQTGRWISPDPHYELLLDADVLDRPDDATGRYRFAANNPTNHVDRDGRFAWAVFGGIVGGVVGGAAEIWKQRAIDGHVTNWYAVAYKTATGATFGALSSGISAISSVAAAKVEVAVYRSRWKKTLAGSIRPMTAEEDHSARTTAKLAGIGVGVAIGLGADLVQAGAETLINAAAGAPVFDHAIEGEQFFETSSGHIGEVAGEPASELAEMAIDRAAESRAHAPSAQPAERRESSS